MTTFTWKVNSLQVMQEPGPNTVTLSTFTILGEDDGTQGSVSYAVNLLPAAPADFVPFDQITEEVAVQWTQEALGPDRVAAMEAEVQKLIDDQKIPTPQPAPLPWETENA